MAWSGIFFGSRMPGVAFAEIVVLWLAILFTMFVFYSLLPRGGAAAVPVFALGQLRRSYLNWGIWRLNRAMSV